MSRIVAIVGRPNVGKSRLFNRLASRRISIVHDKPGVTRDAISADVADGAFVLIDTGGIGLKPGDTSAALVRATESQADFAIGTAALVLFLVDGAEGLTALDDRIAGRLRRSGKPVVLVVNKADRAKTFDASEARQFGFGEPILMSAEHGTGEAELRAAIAAVLGPPPEASAPELDSDSIRICLIGRPNVGKSSLGNTLVGSDRLIVSEIPGTTRDAVELPFEFEARDGRRHPFRLIDTAGIKATGKVASPVEYFSRLRSLDALKRAEVICHVLDAVEGVTRQDQAIAGEAVKERKPVVVAVNKWDLVGKAFRDGNMPDYDGERDYRVKYERAVREQLFFTPGAPIVFLSAHSGTDVGRMLNAVVKLHRTLSRKIPTSKLNQLLLHLAERNPPPAIGARRFRIYYATQTGNRPFTIRLYCNRSEALGESYRRYLEKGLVDEFGLEGCPIVFELEGKPPRKEQE